MKPNFLFLLPIIFAAFSCASEDPANESFQKKYSKTLESIRVQRSEPQIKPSREVVRATGSQDWRDPNFNPNQKLMPGGVDFSGVDKLPADMFDISYNLTNHPRYKKIGEEFDGIEIPDEDFYKVQTEASDKAYLLVNGHILRKNIEQIKGMTTDKDLSNSIIIISEFKEKQRQQKMLQVFNEGGEDDDKKENKKKPIVIKKVKPSNKVASAQERKNIKFN
jgi:hypothetical protein